MLSAQKKSKLTWHCRRGMLELDLILGRFLENHLETMTDVEFDLIETFLTHADPDLYAWLMGYDVPSDQASLDCVTLIRSHHRIQKI